MSLSSPQSGGVMFYILFAIALLAALGFILSQGSRTGTSMVTDEQAKIAAQEILSYSDTLATVIQKLKLRGCEETQFDLENDIWNDTSGTPIHGSGHNPTSSARCSVFSPVTGGAVARLFSPGYFEESSLATPEGTSRIRVSAIPGIATSDADLIYFLPHLTDEVCIKINTALGVSNPGDLPPDYTTTGYDDYEGEFPGSLSLTDTDGVLYGRTAFCAHETSPDSDNRFIHILLAR